MSNSEKPKIYKNPARKTLPSGLKPYVPQYQLMGVEPEEYNSPTSASYRIGQVSKDAAVAPSNPRLPRPVVRQPYAESTDSPVGRGKGPLPNVGNNLEQSWSSSVDGEIVDDLSEAPNLNQEMLDNNDFVSAAALGLPDEMEVTEVNEEEAPEKKEKTFLTGDELQNALKDEYFSEVVKQLKEDDYLLMVQGVAICSGFFEDVQEQARGLVFGEHPLCDGEPISLDDIIIIKRVKIKVGLFLE